MVPDNTFITLFIIFIILGFKISSFHKNQHGFIYRLLTILTSYYMNTGGSFCGVKWRRWQADHSLPSSDEIKHECNCTPTPPYALMLSTGSTLTLLVSVELERKEDSHLQGGSISKMAEFNHNDKVLMIAHNRLGITQS